MGQLAILPKHWWETRNFENVLLEPPLGSGPYKVGKFDLGRFYTMERVPDYWGKDLPINIGTNNYGQIRTTFFQDPEISSKRSRPERWICARRIPRGAGPPSMTFPPSRTGA